MAVDEEETGTTGAGGAARGGGPASSSSSSCPPPPSSPPSRAREQQHDVPPSTTADPQPMRRPKVLEPATATTEGATPAGGSPRTPAAGVISLSPGAPRAVRGGTETRGTTSSVAGDRSEMGSNTTRKHPTAGRASEITDGGGTTGARSGGGNNDDDPPAPPPPPPSPSSAPPATKSGVAPDAGGGGTTVAMPDNDCDDRGDDDGGEEGMGGGDEDPAPPPSSSSAVDASFWASSSFDSADGGGGGGGAAASSMGVAAGGAGGGPGGGPGGSAPNSPPPAAASRRTGSVDSADSSRIKIQIEEEGDGAGSPGGGGGGSPSGRRRSPTRASAAASLNRHRTTPLASGGGSGGGSPRSRGGGGGIFRTIGEEEDDGDRRRDEQLQTRTRSPLDSFDEEGEDDDMDDDDNWGSFKSSSSAAVPPPSSSASAAAAVSSIVTEELPSWRPFGESGEIPPPPPPPPPVSQSPGGHSEDSASILSTTELELCRRLDDEYERALEDREVAWRARYTSVRQSAFLSALFMVLYLLFGCTFYDRHTTWRVRDSLIFTVYTITTVGYGNPHDMPRTWQFQVFTIFYVLTGIAAITVVAAHLYQFIVLEATKVQFSRDRAELSRHAAAAPGGHGPIDSSDPSLHSIGDGGSGRGHDRDGAHRGVAGLGAGPPDFSRRARFMIEFHSQFQAIVQERPFLEIVVDRIVRTYETTKTFLRTTQAGRIVSVFLPFLGLILFGAAVVGGLEGWTAVESVYWAVVTLTTVGFGDYVPTRDASIWFSIFYLPTSLFFMSFFLANVAKSYIRLHAVHVARLERRMRDSIKRAREEAEKRSRGASSPSASPVGGDHHHSDSGGGGGIGRALGVSGRRGSAASDGDAEGDGVDGGAGDPASPDGRAALSPRFAAARRRRRGRRQQNGPAQASSQHRAAAAAAGFTSLATGDEDNNGQSPQNQSAQLFGSTPGVGGVLGGVGGDGYHNGDHSSVGLKYRERVVHNSSQGGAVAGGGGGGGGIVANGHHGGGAGGASPSRKRNKMTSMKAVLRSLRRSSSSGMAMGTTTRRPPPQAQAQAQAGDHHPTASAAAAVPPSAPDYNVDYDATFETAGEPGLVLQTKSSSSSRHGAPPSNQQQSQQQQQQANGGGGCGGSGSSIPSFAVRMLVQERLAQIIATDVAGYQSDVSIKECTLSLTIDNLRETAEKWGIPRRARRAFRAVAFQSLLFVGERDLIVGGADALLCLNPVEFHGLFSPLLAAMGETMEGWLASTNVLADVELRRTTDGDCYGDGRDGYGDGIDGGEGDGGGEYYQGVRRGKGGAEGKAGEPVLC